jgi:hypothetical protein
MHELGRLGTFEQTKRHAPINQTHPVSLFFLKADGA